MSNSNYMGLEPVKPEDRNMTGINAMVLWVGAAIGLGEIFAGSYVAGLGFALGILALFVGKIIGGLPMFATSLIGSREGIPGMVSTRPAFGVLGSYFPSVLNTLQLIGWTAVMIVLGAQACQVVAQSLGIFGNFFFWAALIGILCTVNAMLGHNFWKWFQWFTVGVTVIVSIVMTVVVFQHYSFAELLAKPAPGGITFIVSVDIVIAMSLSWVPLVADYSRYGKNPKRTAHGMYWGYWIASLWMQFVGFLVATATDMASADPIALMTGLGLGVIAVLVIVFSTFTTAFLDIFSTGVAAKNFLPKANERTLVLWGGILGTVVALVFPIITNYENFLLLIGAVFVPLEAVVIVDYFLVRKKVQFEALFQKNGIYWYTGGFNILAYVALIIGFAIYQFAYNGGWGVGSSIPSFVITGVIYYIIAKIAMPSHFAGAQKTSE